MRVAAVDLGLNGAMAMLCTSGRQDVADLARLPTPAGDIIDGCVVYCQLEAWEPEVVVVEDIRPLPSVGRGRRGVTAYTEGSLQRSRGVVEGICHVLGLQVQWVQPQKWKRYYGLIGKDKKESIAVACRLMPSMAPALARVKDHNRAEALLLAYWGMKA